MNDPFAPVIPLVVAGLLAIFPAYFLFRGLTRGPWSRRFANFSLCCGLLTFVMPDLTIDFGDGTRSTIFPRSGWVRLVVGSVGLVLAVTTLITRRVGGTGVARPVIGLLFSLLHVAFAVGLILVGTAFRTPVPDEPTTPSTEWVYHSPGGDYRIRMPSHDWKEVPPIGGEGEVSFHCSVPQMYCSVPSVFRDQTEQDFDRVAAAWRHRTESNEHLRGRPGFIADLNYYGRPFHRGMAIEVTPDGKELFLMYTVTWCAEKRLVVTMIFEGVIGMTSQAGRDAEIEAMIDSAVKILYSVN